MRQRLIANNLVLQIFHVNTYQSQPHPSPLSSKGGQAGGAREIEWKNNIKTFSSQFHGILSKNLFKVA
jgi:hypothetical protein